MEASRPIYFSRLRQALGTLGYQSLVQHGNSGLVALRYISVIEAARPLYFSGPRPANLKFKNVPRAIILYPDSPGSVFVLGAGHPGYIFVFQGW